MAITPIPINLLMTSPTLTPILLASSPVVIVSPTRMRRLMALGTVISVFFILTGATFFSSRHLLKTTSRSSSTFFNFFSIFFSSTLRRGTSFSSSIKTSTGPLPFFLGFSNSLLMIFSGGGVTILSPGFRETFAGLSFFSSGLMILCRDIMGGLTGRITGGCLGFSGVAKGVVCMGFACNAGSAGGLISSADGSSFLTCGLPSSTGVTGCKVGSSSFVFLASDISAAAGAASFFGATGTAAFSAADLSSFSSRVSSAGAASTGVRTARRRITVVLILSSTICRGDVACKSSLTLSTSLSSKVLAWDLTVMPNLSR